ncbi:MAG TPA: 4Fe-4S dicluster domain-containing protein [Acidimicrobiales bacterium]|nr:4Fe-4S dicluster domain-containing protein [Acidimicrobiales bacterium]
MRYGFVVDNRRCIGCHACSVACKAENHVPLGVFRTWVKSVEKGAYPQTRRYFQVTRCNHCEYPPCAVICPVGAMYRRQDGIVDFDPARCIGCKACQQACPYDAIYTDPGSRTAAKCHFCAHRVEAGLEPACVVACPEHAILAGDMDDPDSEVSRALKEHAVRVRRPEVGTNPKLFYVEVDSSLIVPGQARNVGSYLFATVNPHFPRANGHLRGAPPPLGPLDAVVAYDVEHEQPWGWRVPAYFWTKSLSAGALFIPALARLLEGAKLSGRLEGVLSLGGLAFLGLTVGLLISDLSRPERFLNVLRWPRARSWVSRGAFCIAGYGLLLTCLLLSELAGAAGLGSVLLWPTAAAGTAAAVYTAFLFGQCRGRALWQSPVLAVQLLVQCALAGSAWLLLLPGGLGVTAQLRRDAVYCLVTGLFAHASIVIWEVVLPRRPLASGARYAASLIASGPFRTIFWAGTVGLGCLAPATLLALSTTSTTFTALAGAAALAGVGAFEWCFVMAGQCVPNS